VSPSTHLRTERNPVPEMLCFLLFIVPEDGRSSENSCVQNLSDPSKFRFFDCEIETFTCPPNGEILS
jgi:hypothetical protein